MKIEDFLDSLDVDMYSYIYESLEGYGGYASFSEEDLIWWYQFCEEREEKPPFSLADYKNANRIFEEAIEIYNNPIKLANYNFGSHIKQMKRDLRYINLPMPAEEFINILKETFNVLDRVFVDVEHDFMINLEQPYINYIEAIEIKKRKEKQQISKPNQKTNKTPGYIYVMKIKNKPQYKIGVTKDLDKRLTQISPKMPFELEVEYTFETDYTYKIEEYLHNKFDDKQIKGEWFKLDDEDLKYIKGIEEGDIVA